VITGTPLLAHRSSVYCFVVDWWENSSSTFMHVCGYRGLVVARVCGFQGIGCFTLPSSGCLCDISPTPRFWHCVSCHNMLEICYYSIIWPFIHCMRYEAVMVVNTEIMVLWIWHSVVWCIITSVVEEPTTSILKVCEEWEADGISLPRKTKS
jgi:hypothetical protein